MKFKGKIDHWAHLMMLVLLSEAGLMLYLGVDTQSGFYLTLGILLGILLLFLAPIYFNSYYVLEEHELLIRAGCFFAWRIPYTVIIQAVKTDDMSASIGFSLQRLDLEWWEQDKRKRLLIAPEDRELFQRMLLLKNPMIYIDDNQMKTGGDWEDPMGKPSPKLPRKPAPEGEIHPDWKDR